MEKIGKMNYADKLFDFLMADIFDIGNLSIQHIIGALRNAFNK
jgi:hypothetical protein